MLNKNVVRVQTEMFKPGAAVRGALIDLYLNPPSNSVWWPRQPNVAWLEDPNGSPVMRFEDGGFFFTFAALGTEINGRSNGDLDYLLQTHTAAELFQPDLPSLAIMSRERFESLLNQASWAILAVYDVDVSTKKVDFYACLTLDELDSEEANATEGEAA
jgi:hypothetical protein